LEAGPVDLAWYVKARLCYRPALAWLKQYAEERSGLDWAAAILLLAAAAESVFQLCTLLPIDTCADQSRGHLQDTMPFSRALWRAAWGISLPSPARFT